MRFGRAISMIGHSTERREKSTEDSKMFISARCVAAQQRTATPPNLLDQFAWSNNCFSWHRRIHSMEA
jgi:hypothetical protein